MEGYRKMILKSRESLSEQQILISEGNAEPFMDVFDVYLALSAVSGRSLKGFLCAKISDDSQVTQRAITKSCPFSPPSMGAIISRWGLLSIAATLSVRGRDSPPF